MQLDAVLKSGCTFSFQDAFFSKTPCVICRSAFTIVAFSQALVFYLLPLWRFATVPHKVQPAGGILGDAEAGLPQGEADAKKEEEAVEEDVGDGEAATVDQPTLQQGTGGEPGAGEVKHGDGGNQTM